MARNNKSHKELFARAVNSIQKCFSKIIITTNYKIEEKSIGWNSYKSGIYSGWVYAKEYQELVDNRQYSFLISDGSFFQFYYEWKDELVKIKLAYYPVPVKLNNPSLELLEAANDSGIEMLEQLYFDSEDWRGKGFDVVNTSSIRIDFDPEQSSHSKCHMQYGSINEIRMHSEVLVNPFTFFCWIMGQSGPDKFTELLELRDVKSEVAYHQKNAPNCEKARDSIYLSQVNVGNGFLSKIPFGR